MKPLERAALWLLLAFVVAASVAAYHVYDTAVRPAWEKFQELEKKIEKLREMIPKPFREEGDEEISDKQESHL